MGANTCERFRAVRSRASSLPRLHWLIRNTGAPTTTWCKDITGIQPIARRAAQTSPGLTALSSCLKLNGLRGPIRPLLTEEK